MTMRHTPLWIFGILGLLIIVTTATPDTAIGQGPLQPTPYPIVDTPCHPQGDLVLQPSSNQFRFCPEYLVNGLPASAIANITSIEFAPACSELDANWCGHLFYTSPSSGEIAWVGDYNEVEGAYTIHSFASGLTLPNGLAWYDDSWYVSGGPHIYRITDSDGDGRADEIVTLVDNLPTGGAGWTGSLSIGPDNRLYVTTGTHCPDCPPRSPEEGAIVSFALDGSDRQIIATGMHDAFDLAWNPNTGDLVAADSAPAIRGAAQPLDELNLIQTDAAYGWPYCFTTGEGLVSYPHMPPPETNYCTGTEAPIMTFPAFSIPSGLVFYRGDAFPEFADDLLVVLRGQRVGQTPQGYTLMRLCLSPDGQPEACLDAYGNALMDANGQPVTHQILLPVDLFYGYELATLNIQQQGFYPEHPVDIAIGPNGEIALSIIEGRIIQITPVISHLE